MANEGWALHVYSHTLRNPQIAAKVFINDGNLNAKGGRGFPRVPTCQFVMRALAVGRLKRT